MKGQKVKPYDIFTFKLHTILLYQNKIECLATLHNFRSRSSCNFLLKQEFYLLLVESMLIRAKVNFCNGRLRNHAELKLLYQIRFLESSESKVYVLQ